MAKPYSQDLRERVKLAVDEGHTHDAVAAMFKVGKATVERYMARWRETGHLRPDQFGGYKKHRLALDADKVRHLMNVEPDQTLEELRARLAAEKIMVSTSSIDRFLKASGLTYKKKPCWPPNRSARMWRRRAPRGVRLRKPLIRRNSPSSMKPGRPRR